MSREAERIDSARALYRSSLGTPREAAAWDYLLATVREIQHEMRSRVETRSERVITEER